MEESLYAALKARHRHFSQDEIVTLFSTVAEERVARLASDLAAYIATNIPQAFEKKRKRLADYRSNPYVLMTAASIARLERPDVFAKFLFDSKLYMGLEDLLSASQLRTHCWVATRWLVPVDGRHQRRSNEAASLEGLSQFEEERNSAVGRSGAKLTNQSL